jgi:hypothetical protein
MTEPESTLALSEDELDTVTGGVFHLPHRVADGPRLTGSYVVDLPRRSTPPVPQD